MCSPANIYVDALTASLQKDTSALYCELVFIVDRLTYPTRVINIARGKILNYVMQILLNQAHRRRN